MRGLRTLFVLILMVLGFIYFTYGKMGGTDYAVFQIEQIFSNKETKLESKSPPSEVNPITGLKGSLYRWMGMDIRDLESELGEPIRKSISTYGYNWWVYTNQQDQYFQFGVQDNEIVTIYATGENISITPVEIGQPYSQVEANFNFKNDVSFTKGLTSYRFQLSNSDLESRPLTQIGKNRFIQFYFDTFTDKLSSIRIMNTDILLLQRPNEIFYRGELPETPVLSDSEWNEAEKGMEKQIFDITNILRNRYGKSLLSWDDQVSKVALGHSKDMKQKNYFSHYTEDGKGLAERLEENQVYYLSAGENIAAQYTDGPAAVEGWLNSKGHREALLKNNYTHLGVGVFRYYYTQNFLEKLD